MTTRMRKLLVAVIVLLGCTLAFPPLCPADDAAAGPAGTEEPQLTWEQIRKLRKDVAHRKRRIIFHSDGKPMDSGNMRFPYIPGTQTDSCTYSLIHQFNLARFYKTEVAQPWPPGYLEDYRKKHGGRPADLERYIAFCRKNNYEAFWAQRMNDTHDAAYTEDGRWKFANNNFKQEHPDWLLGKNKKSSPRSPDGKWVGEDFYHCPHGRWSGVDYTHKEVRAQMYRTWEEVCRNFDIDGLMFDFFRHPASFRSTAMGHHASDMEVAMMTDLLRRTREMADKIGAARGRPILLIARTPDEPRYAKGLGLDLERWMAEDIIDIWLAAGYFRLQEWEDIVKLGHRYGVPVWASMDEVRTRRPACNSPAASRARAMNMWNAGVDGIYVFNFAHKPPSAEFNLLHEIGDPATIAYLPKMYVPDARSNLKAVQWWLKGGESYVTRNTLQALPQDLTDGKPKTIDLLVGDDLPAAEAKGFRPTVKLRLYVSGLTDAGALLLKLNDREIEGGGLDAERNLVRFKLAPAQVKKGFNRFEVTLSTGKETKTVLEDLQLWISYDQIKGRKDALSVRARHAPHQPIRSIMAGSEYCVSRPRRGDCCSILSRIDFMAPLPAERSDFIPVSFSRSSAAPFK